MSLYERYRDAAKHFFGATQPVAAGKATTPAPDAAPAVVPENLHALLAAELATRLETAQMALRAERERIVETKLSDFRLSLHGRNLGAPIVDTLETLYSAVLRDQLHVPDGMGGRRPSNLGQEEKERIAGLLRNLATSIKDGPDPKQLAFVRGRTGMMVH